MVKFSLVPGVAAIEKVLKTYVVACDCSVTVVGAVVYTRIVQQIKIGQ